MRSLIEFFTLINNVIKIPVWHQAGYRKRQFRDNLSVFYNYFTAFALNQCNCCSIHISIVCTDNNHIMRIVRNCRCNCAAFQIKPFYKPFSNIACSSVSFNYTYFQSIVINITYCISVFNLHFWNNGFCNKLVRYNFKSCNFRAISFYPEILRRNPSYINRVSHCKCFIFRKFSY